MTYNSISSQNSSLPDNKVLGTVVGVRKRLGNSDGPNKNQNEYVIFTLKLTNMRLMAGLRPAVTGKEVGPVPHIMRPSA